MALILLALLPILVFAGLLVHQLATAQERTLQAQVTDTARTLTFVIDQEVGRAQAVLRGLATSSLLRRGDLAAFHEQARQVVPGDDSWIILFNRESDQLLNTVRPFGTSLPKRVHAPAVDQVLETGKPAVTGLLSGSVVKRPVVGTAAPVWQNGEIHRVLALTFGAETLSALLAAQPLPEDWTVALLDGTGHIIARNRTSERYVGDKAVPELVSAIMADDRGALWVDTLEGMPTYAAFKRSALSGWTIAVGAPEAALGAPLRRSLALLLGGGSAFLLLAVVLAAMTARRIARPIRALAAAAASLGRGEVPKAPDSAIREVDDAGKALVEAGILLRQGAAERDAVELALRESEQRFRDIAANLPGVIIRRVTYPDGRIEYPFVSENAARLFGLPGDAGSSIRTIDDLVNYIDPDDLRRWWAAMQVAAEKLEPMEAEGRLRSPDGQVRWMRSIARPRRRADGATVWDGVTLDVTAQKEAEAALRHSEERLREAQEIAGLGRWDFDVASGRIIWSDEVFRIFGRDPEAGTPTFDELRELLHPDDRPVFESLVQRALREGKDFETEWRARRPDGSYRWKRTRARVYRDDSGRVARLVGIDLDITDRKLAEERQRLLMAELDHRVKNVLAVVQAIAKQTLPPDKPAEAYEGRLAALAQAHSLLAASRWEGANLQALLEQTIAPHRGTGAGQVTLAGEDAMLGPKTAQTLALALHELTTNAAKYGALSTPEGRVEITWNVERRPEGHRLSLRWIERDGPPVTAPATQGFGSVLLESGLSYDLGGDVRLEFRRQGVSCEIEIPLPEHPGK